MAKSARKRRPQKEERESWQASQRLTAGSVKTVNPAGSSCGVCWRGSQSVLRSTVSCVTIFMRRWLGATSPPQRRWTSDLTASSTSNLSRQGSHIARCRRIASLLAASISLSRTHTPARAPAAVIERCFARRSRFMSCSPPVVSRLVRGRNRPTGCVAASCRG